jgi:hypothetical protein
MLKIIAYIQYICCSLVLPILLIPCYSIFFEKGGVASFLFIAMCLTQVVTMVFSSIILDHMD